MENHRCLALGIRLAWILWRDRSSARGIGADAEDRCLCLRYGPAASQRVRVQSWVVYDDCYLLVHLMEYIPLAPHAAFSYMVKRFRSTFSLSGSIDATEHRIIVCKVEDGLGTCTWMDRSRMALVLNDVLAGVRTARHVRARDVYYQSSLPSLIPRILVTGRIRSEPKQSAPIFQRLLERHSERH